MSTSETKTCQHCKKDFVIEPEDFAFYEKVRVPSPTFCPECRLQRRLVWRNERSFYKRKCDAPGHSEEMIAFFDTGTPFPVYDQRFWWGDGWDPTAYGRDYDFSRPFFEQLLDLMNVVPHPSLSTDYTTMVNSDYSNWAGSLKNCYLVTDADYVEDSAYCSSIFKSKDCYDSHTISESELCYESFNLGECYHAVGSVSCRECSNIYFCKGCVGCSNCFGSMNLRKKSYYIFNQPYKKEEYEAKVRELLDGSRSSFNTAFEKAKENWLRHPHRALRGLKNVNSFGDYIYNSKNTKYGFYVSDVEDSKYVALIHSPGTKDCFDYTDWGDNAQRVYDSIGCGLGVYDVKFSNLVVKESRDVQYSYFCINSSNLFGCVSLRKKQYCILNKEYSKEEYKALLPKIIEHRNAMPFTDSESRVYRYGEFFPPSLSPFAYNETAAQEFCPLTKKK